MRVAVCGVGGHAEVVVVVFFFQAEDGIRDIGVTGVQTCALPISCHVKVLFRPQNDDVPN